MRLSRLTSKYQATIPKEIREMLKLSPGDTVCFQITEEGKVVLKRGKPVDKLYAQALNATLDEWKSKEDEEAYEHLQDI